MEKTRTNGKGRRRPDRPPQAKAEPTPESPLVESPPDPRPANLRTLATAEALKAARLAGAVTALGTLRQQISGFLDQTLQAVQAELAISTIRAEALREAVTIQEES